MSILGVCELFSLLWIRGIAICGFFFSCWICSEIVRFVLGSVEECRRNSVTHHGMWNWRRIKVPWRTLNPGSLISPLMYLRYFSNSVYFLLLMFSVNYLYWQCRMCAWMTLRKGWLKWIYPVCLLGVFVCDGLTRLRDERKTFLLIPFHWAFGVIDLFLYFLRIRVCQRVNLVYSHSTILMEENLALTWTLFAVFMCLLCDGFWSSDYCVWVLSLHILGTMVSSDRWK